MVNLIAVKKTKVNMLETNDAEKCNASDKMHKSENILMIHV